MVEPSAWAIHAVHPPLDTYVRRRVALLGDAAHGMPPHLGAGAGQAIEDSRTLVQLLTHPKIGRHNVEVCLGNMVSFRIQSCVPSDSLKSCTSRS